MSISEAQRKAHNKYDKENMAIIATKAKKGEIEQCREYAKKINLSPSKFALEAMKYCIKNKIEFNNEEN